MYLCSSVMSLSSLPEEYHPCTVSYIFLVCEDASLLYLLAILFWDVRRMNDAFMLLLIAGSSVVFYLAPENKLLPKMIPIERDP